LGTQCLGQQQQLTPKDPSELIQIINGKLGLATWQNIFFVNLMAHELNETLYLPFIKQADF
jgi:thiamine phosphate synthase YjbQ (UPF0047 family)